jgi:hypothetical protein
MRLGTIITRGIEALFAEILSITMMDRRFSSIPIYISLILIRTITSSPVGIQIRAPFLSILCINLLCFIPVISRAGRYLVSNQLQKEFSECILTR